MNCEEENCILCGTKNYQIVSRHVRGYSPLQAVVCRDCGMVSLNPMPCEKDLREFYATAYREQYKKVSRPKAKHVLRAGLGAMQRLRFLKTLPLAADASVLDVGAGLGAFVYLARKFGYRTEGIEPHQGYVAFAEAELSTKLKNAGLQDALLPAAEFDLVTLCHVLEHLRDPVAELRRLHACLREDGLLVVEVPNIMARYHAPYRQFHLAHLYYFSPWSLTAAAAQAGFALESLRLQPGTQHILGVFRRAGHVPAPSGKEDNLRKTVEKLKHHTVVRHYFSHYPYTRPIGHVFQFIAEITRLRGLDSPRQILDDLHHRTGSGGEG